MKNSYTKVDFNNATNPKSEFDLILLKQMLSRNHSGHSPFSFHQVEFFSIIFFQKGTGKHTIDFIDYECKKGTLLTVRKDQIHKFSNSNLDGILMIFTFDFLGSFFAKEESYKSLLLFNEFLNSPKIQLSQNQYDFTWEIIKRMKEEYLGFDDEHSPSIIRSELQILINKLYRIKAKKVKTNQTKKYISEFIQFQNCIEDRFSQSLKVKDYSKWLGMSTKTLNAVTQNIVQKSAKEFIDEICLNHIKRQLINTEKPIKEISYETGFEEPTNFYNYFKKRLSKTPDQYRKTYR